MRFYLITAIALLFCIAASGQNKDANSEGWISLFDGKTFTGWKASEHPNTFTIADGTIIVFGDRAHLFYDGQVGNHNFKNFEFKATVMTTPGSNSGMFIHTTAYQGRVDGRQKDMKYKLITHILIGAKREVYMEFRM